MSRPLLRSVLNLISGLYYNHTTSQVLTSVPSYHVLRLSKAEDVVRVPSDLTTECQAANVRFVPLCFHKTESMVFRAWILWAKACLFSQETSLRALARSSERIQSVQASLRRKASRSSMQVPQIRLRLSVIMVPLSSGHFASAFRGLAKAEDPLHCPNPAMQLDG